jgi:HEAT repeat protein
VADRSTPAITASILCTALAAAGTDEARAALLQLAREGDAEVRLLGVRALTQLRGGDAESLDTLRSLLGDADPGVATAASLALGANVRGGGGADDAKASAIGALTSMYEDAPDDATQRTAVLALGNAGGRDALPVLLDALGEGAPLAEAATYGLRYVPGDDVDQVLDGILQQGSPGQRLAAVNAVMERDHGTWAPKLAALLDGDLPQQVRQAIVAALR